MTIASAGRAGGLTIGGLGFARISPTPAPAPAPSPSLDLDFTTALPAAVTYTGPAVSVIQSGVLTALGANVAPLESWDGVNRGLLLFKAATNLITYSNKFDDASYTATGLGTRVAGGAGPDGVAASSWNLTETATTNLHEVKKKPGSRATGERGTVSAFVRVAAGTRVAARLDSQAEFDNNGARSKHRLDLTQGYTYTVEDSTKVTTPYGRVKKLANGWFLIEQTGTWATTGNKQFVLGLLDYTSLTTNQNNYAGAITNTFEVYGMQYVVGTQAGPYIHNAAATTNSITAGTGVISDISAISTTTGTFVIEHDCSEGILLGSGVNTLVTATAPGRIAVAYDATETRISVNGGTITTGPALTFGADLRLLGTSATQNTGHLTRLRPFNTKFSDANLVIYSAPTRTVTTSTTQRRTVATKNRIPSAFQAMSGTVLNFYFRFRVSVVVENDSVKVVFPNFAFATNNTNSFIIDKAVLERDAVAETVPVKVAASRSFTVATESGTPLESDAITASQFTSMAKVAASNVSQDFWLKGTGRVTTAAHQVPTSRLFSEGASALDCCGMFDPAVTTLSDTDTPGLYTSTGTARTTMNSGYCPLIVGLPTVDGKSVINIGDSTSEGVGTTQGLTFVRKACVALAIPTIEFNKGGTAQSDISDVTFWVPYLKYVRETGDQMGTNNVNRLMDFWKIWDIAKYTYNHDRLIHCGLFPRASASTDSYTTEAGQTVSRAYQTDIDRFFTQQRNYGVLDLSFDPQSERGTLAGTWKVDGTAFKYTGDGVHPSDFADTSIATEFQPYLSALTVT